MPTSRLVVGVRSVFHTKVGDGYTICAGPQSLEWVKKKRTFYIANNLQRLRNRNLPKSTRLQLQKMMMPLSPCETKIIQGCMYNMLSGHYARNRRKVYLHYGAEDPIGTHFRAQKAQFE